MRNNWPRIVIGRYVLVSAAWCVFFSAGAGIATIPGTVSGQEQPADSSIGDAQDVNLDELWGQPEDGEATAPGEEEPPQGPSFEEVWNEAKKMVDEGRRLEAIEIYTQIIESPRLPRGLVVAARYERGKSFAELKEYDLASRSFAEALRDMKRSAMSIVEPKLGIEIYWYTLLLELAKIHVELPERINDAIAEMDEAIEIKPSESELYYYRGLALSRKAARVPGQQMAAIFEQAVTSFDRAIELKEDYGDAYFERGKAKLQLAAATVDFDEAIADLEKARGIDPENLEYVVRTAVAYLNRARQQEDRDEKTAEIIADHQTALTLLDEFIEKHPDRPTDETQTGDDLGATGADAEKDEEDEDETKIEEALVFRADARMNLAKYLPEAQRAAQYHAAIEDCNTALRVEEQFPTAYFNRGVAWRMLNDYRQALDDLSKALEISSGFLEANLRRGIIWFHLGEYDIALGDFKRAMLRPRFGRPDVRARFWAGAAYAQLGDYVEAVEQYSDAIRDDPGFTLAYNNRGLAYLQLGRYQRAIDDFTELIRRDRNSAKSYYRRGLAYDRLGKSDKARRSFQQAVELDPSLTLLHPSTKR